MRELSFHVPGRPVPQGSIRSLGKGRPSIHGNAATLLPWRDSITAAAILAMQECGWQRIEGPVQMHTLFYFDRPRSHYGTGKNAATLKDNAPAMPCGRGQGDLEKLVRSVSDALTAAGVWHDDSQVSVMFGAKRWTEPLHAPGLGVRVQAAW